MSKSKKFGGVEINSLKVFKWDVPSSDEGRQKVTAPSKERVCVYMRFWYPVQFEFEGVFGNTCLRSQHATGQDTTLNRRLAVHFERARHISNTIKYNFIFTTYPAKESQKKITVTVMNKRKCTSQNGNRHYLWFCVKLQIQMGVAKLYYTVSRCIRNVLYTIIHIYVYGYVYKYVYTFAYMYVDVYIYINVYICIAYINMCPCVYL